MLDAAGPGSPRRGRPRHLEKLKRRGRAGCGCVIVVAGLSILILLSLGVPVALFAFGPELGFLAYRAVVLPVVTVESTLIEFGPGPRLLFFAVWLFLILVCGFGLTRVVGQRIRSDSVVSVLALSTTSVLVAFSVTSWMMYGILLILGLLPSD